MIEILSEEDIWAEPEDREDNLIYARMSFAADYRYVNFAVDISDFSLDDYIKQWENAANYALKHRQTTALFTSFYPHTEVFACSCYVISPRERLSFLYDEYDADDINEADFLLTEGIFYLTTQLEVLNNDSVFQYLYNTYQTNIPIYFVNPKNIEHFYAYIPETDVIEILKGCWYRKLQERDLVKLREICKT